MTVDQLGMAEVLAQSHFVTQCANCLNIMSVSTGRAVLSHGICKSCCERLYPGLKCKEGAK